MPAVTPWPTRGMITRAIQAYLGHRNIQHTVRYTELTPTRFWLPVYESTPGSSCLSCIKFRDGLNCANADPLSAIDKTVQQMTKAATEVCRKLMVIITILEFYSGIDFRIFEFCIFQISGNIPRQCGWYQAGLWRYQAIR